MTNRTIDKIETSAWPVTMSQVYQARQAILPHIRRTPLVFSPTLSELVNGEVWLKLENMQVTGSFKIRGAATRMLQLTEAEKSRGVVAVSSGNHGRAVAAFSQQLGIKSIICMSSLVPANKIAAIEGYGAEARIIGDSQDDAQEEADRLIAEENMTWVAPYDDPIVISGQATIALEIIEELPTVDTVIAPLSGGGLLSGIAIAAKAADPSIRVIGASMEVEPGMVKSLEAGHPVTVDEFPSLADSLGGSIGLNNTYTFPIIRDLMDQAVLIAETELAPAMRHIFQNEGMVIEGGSAVAIAAMFGDKIPDLAGRKIAAVISGRNIDPAIFQEAVIA